MSGDFAEAGSGDAGGRRANRSLLSASGGCGFAGVSSASTSMTSCSGSSFGTRSGGAADFSSVRFRPESEGVSGSLSSCDDCSFSLSEHSDGVVRSVSAVEAVGHIRSGAFVLGRGGCVRGGAASKKLVRELAVRPLDEEKDEFALEAEDWELEGSDWELEADGLVSAGRFVSRLLEGPAARTMMRTACRKF